MPAFLFILLPSHKSHKNYFLFRSNTMMPHKDTNAAAIAATGIISPVFGISFHGTSPSSMVVTVTLHFMLECLNDYSFYSADYLILHLQN